MALQTPLPGTLKAQSAHGTVVVSHSVPELLQPAPTSGGALDRGLCCPQSVLAVLRVAPTERGWWHHGDKGDILGTRMIFRDNLTELGTGEDIKDCPSPCHGQEPLPLSQGAPSPSQFGDTLCGTCPVYGRSCGVLSNPEALEFQNCVFTSTGHPLNLPEQLNPLQLQFGLAPCTPGPARSRFGHEGLMAIKK